MPKKPEEIVEETVVTEATEGTEVVEEATEEKPAKKTATAKAGKRSAKAAKEAEEAEAKEAKKQEKAEAAEKADAPKPKAKPRVKKYSKNQKAMREAIDFDKLYTLDEAVALLQKVSTAKFDPTLELHIRLDIDPRQADQTVRASTALPAGSGKTVRVAVLTADDKKAKAAAEAGADVTDSEQLLADISKGTLDFDVLVATPDTMAQLGRHAKTLGPKGLMPSPKSGTVTADPAAAVKEIKQGRLEVKNDANGIIHAAVGKLSFKAEDLVANGRAVLQCVQTNRPSGVKGTYVKSITVAATMTPGVKLDTAELVAK
ncbi:50S ribosomal protein L1 [bacterium]|nr:50S ribosomal protein L1 [bacterium]